MKKLDLVDIKFIRVFVKGFLVGKCRIRDFVEGFEINMVGLFKGRRFRFFFNI